MKKYLFKQAKKSLSLFLAVVMLMSCWVWMAPEKADAAKFTPLTQYTVTVKWQLVDRKGTYTGGNIKYKTLGDGWGSESGEQIAVNSLSDCLTNNKSYSKSWTTTSFPTVIMVSYEGGNTEWGGATQDANKARCEVLEILINDKTVWKGNSGYNGANTATFYPDYNASTGNDGTSGSGGGTFTWPRPMLVGFNDDTANASDIAVSLNAIGGQDITKTADYNIAKYDCYNQYGVKIADPTNYVNNGRVCPITEQTTYVSGTKNSDDPLTGEDAADIYATANDKDTVVIKPNLQISNPQGTKGSATYYLVRKYILDDKLGGSITSKVSAKITVTYPKYTVNFNGGVSTAKITADKEYTGSYSAQGYHGTNITVPSKTAADGYTFYEYWSKPQPATGAASYNAAATDFAKPCSSGDYASYLADGGTEKDGIVTDKDGGKWYDAGKTLDPTTAKTIDVSENKANFVENWYAWWLAKDLSVKFYDVDGTFLGEKLVKSGQTANAIEWPTSKYIDSGYTTGAFKFKVDANLWETTDGTEINKNSYTFTKDLILTPKLTRESFQSKYAVTFIHPNNGGSVAVGTEGTYDYRADIKNYADIAKGKIPAVPAAIDGDLQYRYELLGWSSVEPTTGAKYHILQEDRDFDVNGTAIGLNSDWVVRNEATYYAVYRRYTKTYVVNFNFKDATGADATRQVKFKYGDKLKAPTEYVPYNYVTKGFGYTFANWEYTNADGVKATFVYNGEVAFTSENFEIAAAALEGSEPLEPIVIKAAYGEGVPTPYSVTFNYKDDEGEDVSSSVTVKNEEFILQETVNGLTPAKEWDDGESLYTFANKWEITEGAATVGIGGAEKKVGDIINTAALITLTPTSNIKFKAVYANPVPYYTVTYIDGSDTFTGRVLQESNVPEWTIKVTNDNGTPDDTTDDFEEDKIYVPADYEGEGGTYVFQGWFDAATGGNKVTTADKVTSDLTLYSQFKFVPDTFTITFMNHDGSVQLAAGKYEKGQNIEALVTTATKAAQGRTKDDTYTYKFIGWDKAVPTFCEGYDVTYTALYKSEYRYYDVKWYNSVLVDDEWVAEEERLVATTKHTYNSRLYAPSSAGIECPVQAPNGQKYVFAGWYYNDENGNAVKYERGITVTGEMEFYATYTLTDKYYTVTAKNGGDSATYNVVAGGTVIISDPVSGYVDETNHNEFTVWLTDDGKEFTAETEVNADITITAQFAVGTHERTNKETVKEATYFEEGTEISWCSCDKEKTKVEADLPKLQDVTAPVGTIYLGGQSWSSTDENGANATDGDRISIFANKNTDVVITAKDDGIGVKVIRAFAFPADTVLTVTNYGAAQSLATDVYNAPTEKDKDGNDVYVGSTNVANYAIKLGDLVVADLNEDGDVQYNDNGSIKYKRLQDGEAYIIYYYVNDKATGDNGAPATGNQLNRKVRTAKFIYDNTAPAFTVKGDSNNAVVPTYCGSVTVTGLEKDVTLTVNGDPKDITYAETGTCVISYAEGMDNLMITATDKAGNTFSKKIKIGQHSWYTDEVSSTCTTDGYKKTECLLCGKVSEDIVYAAVDHIMGMPEIIPADCVNNGYVVNKCQNCDYEIRTDLDEENNPVLPAAGHIYAEDDNGIIYAEVTASTCKTPGTKEAVCTVCGGGKLVESIAINPENHEDTLKVESLEAGCEVDGYEVTYYPCCGNIENKYIEKIVFPATGHGNIDDGTAEWYTSEKEEEDPNYPEATCYEEGVKALKCLNCSNFITDKNGVVITETIPATGEHIKTVANPDTYKTEGVVKYKCATEGCPYEYEDKILEAEETLGEFTVTFVEENNNVITAITKTEGDSILKGAVVAPEKADSADDKYKYTFAGWVEVNADGTEGTKIYKLPITVTKDMTLKAVYKESLKMYTHLFRVPVAATATVAEGTETKVYKTLVGAIGDVRVPSGTPTFPADQYNTYKFEGWAKEGTETIVTDFTVAGDAEFIAVFSAEAKKYNVFFYDGVTLFDMIENVTAGETVSVPDDAPEKAFDEAKHYTFAGWYTADDTEFDFATKITADTKLYAKYEGAEHVFVPDGNVESVVDGKPGIIQAGNCGTDEITAKICSCGKTKEEVTAKATGLHTKTTREEIDENGIKNIITYCSVCNEEFGSEKATYTIKFKVDGKEVYRTELNANDNIVYDVIPEKAADAQYTYTFKCWKLGDTEVADLGKADADKEFVAVFKETLREYKVAYFADNEMKVKLQEVTVKYGDPVPAFTGTAPTKAYNENDHFVFAGWSVAVDTEVKGNTPITPVFNAIKHTYVETGTTTGATCTENGGSVLKCTVCGKTSYGDIIFATGHDYTEVVDKKEATCEADGYIIRKCANCDDTKKETIKHNHKDITVTVKDANGKLVDGAKVELYRDGSRVDAKITNSTGVVVFEACYEKKYEYKVLISGVEGLAKNEYEVGSEGTVETEFGEKDNSCTCSCHRPGFWGIIFRFFHKMISWFTGRIGCCSCPDEAY